MRSGRFVFALLALLIAFSCKGDPRASRDEFYQSGERYLEEEQYLEALIEFRNSIQLDEEFVAGHLGAAKVYQKLNDNQNAWLEYRRVVELDDSQTEAKLEVGKYHLLAGAQEPDNYSRARELAEEILEHDPDNLQARIMLGNSYAGLNDLERSLEEMRTVLDEDPENLVAKLNMGMFQLTLRDADQAEKTFLEALATHPGSTLIHRALGNLYMVTKSLDRAENHFRRAFELDRKELANLYSLSRFYLLIQKRDRAREVFEEAVEADPESREPRWALANYYVAGGELARGKTPLEQLLEEYPDDRMTKLRLAELYLGDNRERVGRLVTDLLDANEKDAEAHYLKGRLLLAEDDQEAAMEEFDRAVRLKNWLLPAYMQKASLHLARQELDLAQEALREILRFDEDNVDANAGIARILVANRRPEEALNRAEAVLSVQPNNIDALRARGEAYLMLGRATESEKDFLKLSQLQPQNPFYLHRLGATKVLQGADSEALGYLRAAVEIDPDLTDAVNDIIYIHLRKKQFSEALREIDQFMASSSRKDTLHVFRGRIFMSQDRFELAEKEFRRSIELNRENYQAFLLLGQLKVSQNNLAQAVHEVDQLLAQNDRYAPAHLLKAYFLDLKKDVSSAIQHYQRTLELSPDNPVAANNLAWLYCEGGQNMNEALQLARTARQRDPNNAQYADTLGWIHYKLQNYVLAVDQLSFSVNSGQPKAENYYRLGMAYYRKGEGNLAKQSLKKAVEMNNSFPGIGEAQAVLTELG